MQYKKELSFLSYKARLCSLPTTRCDPFTPATKSSHIIRMQFQIQFHIHHAVKTKTREESAVSLKIDNHCKIVCYEYCVLDKNFKNIGRFISMFGLQKLFWREFLIGLWNNNLESQTVAIQRCCAEFLSLMFNWVSVGTRGWHYIGISIFTQTFDVRLPFNDKTSVMLVNEEPVLM